MGVKVWLESFVVVVLMNMCIVLYFLLVLVGSWVGGLWLSGTFCLFDK